MSTFKVDTLQSTTGGVTTLTKQSAAKAWLSYDQSIPTVNGSFNQSSTTDVQTGYFNLNFSNNMTNKDYPVAGAGAATVIVSHHTTANNIAGDSTTSACRVRAFYLTGSSTVVYYDSRPATINIHGDLA
jgi:hypothetical protein